MDKITYQEGQPLSDLQEYNLRLKENTKAIYTIGIAFIATILLLAIIGWFVADYFNIIDYIAYKLAMRC